MTLARCGVDLVARSKDLAVTAGMAIGRADVADAAVMMPTLSPNLAHVSHIASAARRHP